MTWYSFDRIASHYDATRKLDPHATQGLLAFLAKRVAPRPDERALELGIGTGRIALPFASYGYSVVGVDISREMLARLRGHLAERPDLPIQSVRADAAHLPFRDGSFAMVYWVHVLHLVPRWRQALDEALRVTRPGGTLLDLNTAGGRDSTDLSVRYRAIATRKGYPQPRIGVRRRQTILANLERRGCRVERIRTSWPWRATTTVAKVLRDLDRRTYATLNYVPPGVHAAIMAELRGWTRRTYGPRPPPLAVAGRIRVQIVTRPALRLSARARGAGARRPHDRRPSPR
ncbi:MAG: methyltransferase domain-containing protein [Thermoplasmata archaeon]|nr:methyltransferase domain-containing protein [Thermoplasmata archaeon]